MNQVSFLKEMELECLVMLQHKLASLHKFGDIIYLSIDLKNQIHNSVGNNLSIETTINY